MLLQATVLQLPFGSVSVQLPVTRVSPLKSTVPSLSMREASQDKTRARLAEQATGWVKPLVLLAGGIINGDGAADVDYIMTH